MDKEKKPSGNFTLNSEKQKAPRDKAVIHNGSQQTTEEKRGDK